MSILLDLSQRKRALYALREFFTITVYPRLASQTDIAKIEEHLAHLRSSDKDLETTVKIASSELAQRTVIEITMDLKGTQDVSLKPNG